MKKKNFRRNLIFAIFLLFLFFLNCLLLNDSVWQDEIFTLNAIKLDFGNMMDLLIMDVHPPLYYFILKFLTMILPLGVAFLKVVSILPTFLTMIVVHHFLNQHEELNDTHGITSFLFALILGLSYPFLNYNLEIRMYSFTIFFVTCSGLLAYQVYQKETRFSWFLFILFSLLAAYTHYFALVTEVFIYFYLFLALLRKKKGNLKKCLLVSLITFVGYLPWLFFFIKQFIVVRGDYWITFTFRDLWEWIQFACLKLHPIFILLILAIIFHAIYRFLIKKERDSKTIFSLLLSSIPFLLIGTGLLLTFLIRPLFIARYVLPGLALGWLGFLLMLGKRKKSPIWYAVFAVILIGSIGVTYPHLLHQERNTKTFETVEKITKIRKDGDLFVTNMSYFTSHVSPYYFPDNEIINLEDFLEREEKEERNVWYLDRSDASSISTLEEAGYQVEKKYHGHIDENYSFDFYQISKN